MQIMKPELWLHDDIMQCLCTCQSIYSCMKTQAELHITAKEFFRTLDLRTYILKF